jgi:hypothetical protein
MFNLLGIVLYSFFICNIYDRMIWVINLKSLRCSILFFSDVIILFFILKIYFVVIFNFFYLGLSWSHDLSYEFCRSFFNGVFFPQKICFLFNFWRYHYDLSIIFLFYTNGPYFFKIKNIFLIYLALHNIFFLLFYSTSFMWVSIIFYWF